MNDTPQPPTESNTTSLPPVLFPIDNFRYLGNDGYELHNQDHGHLRHLASQTTGGGFMFSIDMSLGFPSDKPQSYMEQIENYNFLAPKHQAFLQEMLPFLQQLQPTLGPCAEWLEVSPELLAAWLHASMFQLRKFLCHFDGVHPDQPPKELSDDALQHNSISLIAQLLFRRYHMGFKGLPPVTCCKVMMLRSDLQKVHQPMLNKETSEALGFGQGYVEPAPRDLPILPKRARKASV